MPVRGVGKTFSMFVPSPRKHRSMAKSIATGKPQRAEGRKPKAENKEHTASLLPSAYCFSRFHAARVDDRDHHRDHSRGDCVASVSKNDPGRARGCLA